jgi:hypothetical protein
MLIVRPGSQYHIDGLVHGQVRGSWGDLFGAICHRIAEGELTFLLIAREAFGRVLNVRTHHHGKMGVSRGGYGPEINPSSSLRSSSDGVRFRAYRITL